jgi:hypothetical protein
VGIRATRLIRSPGVYRNANWPQGWSASSVFCLIQAMTGLYPYAPLDLLLLDPHLPPWLPDLTVRNLRVGDAAVDLHFHRGPRGDSSYEVLEVRGTLHVVRQPSPWSLTAGPWERVKDALMSLIDPERAVRHRRWPTDAGMRGRSVSVGARKTSLRAEVRDVNEQSGLSLRQASIGISPEEDCRQDAERQRAHARTHPHHVSCLFPDRRSPAPRCYDTGCTSYAARRRPGQPKARADPRGQRHSPCTNTTQLHQFHLNGRSVS